MNYWKQREKVQKAERDGHTVTLPQYPGWGFRVRRMCSWNADYQRALVRIAQRPEAAALAEAAASGRALTEAERAADAEMLREAFAEGCMIGWEGVCAENGAPLDFSVLRARVVVLQHFPDIFSALSNAASDGRNFGEPDPAELRKAAAGN